VRIHGLNKKRAVFAPICNFLPLIKPEREPTIKRLLAFQNFNLEILLGKTCKFFL